MFILSQEHFSFACPARKEARGAQEVLGGRQPGLLTPAGQRDVPYHMVTGSVYNLRGKLARDHCSGTGWVSVGEQLHCASLTLCDIIVVFIIMIINIFSLLFLYH